MISDKDYDTLKTMMGDIGVSYVEGTETQQLELKDRITNVQPASRQTH